ncbi:MAG: hypothetical protein COX16_11205 [Deltaproteobacteria bacterium CG23_combo_of_CG06-09_8_20_14_all_51_20]|nr:MAG: hypothetical protein COX16_11205 [Deltaproteobacteria bacterium CG23_combo_of_CG06-09_8_20_14_all_51_20]PIY21621.1 MAG: hypothetical protein COZ11_15670 [Deltaproteobacteria bacterium CG_4_10_14_3_um_filter_51_14]
MILEVVSADLSGCLHLNGSCFSNQEIHLMAVFRSPVTQRRLLSCVTQVGPQFHGNELLKALFGSYAAGIAREGSDIDLIVVSDD